jgi:hypothetical protein
MLKGSDAIKEIFGSGLTFLARHHFTAVFVPLLKFIAAFP